MGFTLGCETPSVNCTDHRGHKMLIVWTVSRSCRGEDTFSVVTYDKGYAVVLHRSCHMIQSWLSTAQQAAPAAVAWATHGH